MNRITRCPACATVYRVDQDQLQAAGGWLRCGQCLHVFDSVGLVMIWEAATPPASANAIDQTLVQLLDTSRSEQERIPLDDLLRHEDRPTSPLSSSDSLASFEKALSTFQPQPLPLQPVGQPAQASQEMALSTGPESVPTGGSAVSLRQRGGHVLAWLLAVLLVLQGLFVQRQVMATHWPAASLLWARVCQVTGCDMSPLQNVDGLVIESSSLVRRPDDFVLRWAIRNTTHSTLAMTALELTLLETPEKPVLRKVFFPDQMGAPATVSPGQIWAGELVLKVDAQTVFTDYRILSFYP